jgi:hypothetical protein
MTSTAPPPMSHAERYGLSTFDESATIVTE